MTRRPRFPEEANEQRPALICSPLLNSLVGGCISVYAHKHPGASDIDCRRPACLTLLPEPSLVISGPQRGAPHCMYAISASAPCQEYLAQVPAAKSQNLMPAPARDSLSSRSRVAHGHGHPRQTGELHEITNACSPPAAFSLVSTADPVLSGRCSQAITILNTFGPKRSGL